MCVFDETLHSLLHIQTHEQHNFINLSMDQCKEELNYGMEVDVGHEKEVKYAEYMIVIFLLKDFE